MGGFVAGETRDPAAYAADIDAARDRMIAFVGSCTEQEWSAAPLDGDPRPVGVEVDSDVVDALNARHALTWAVRTSSSTAESSG